MVCLLASSIALADGPSCDVKLKQCDHALTLGQDVIDMQDEDIKSLKDTVKQLEDKVAESQPPSVAKQIVIGVAIAIVGGYLGYKIGGIK